MRFVQRSAVLLCLAWTSLLAQSADETDFLHRHTDFREARGMLAQYLNKRALGLLEARKQTIAGLSSREDVTKRRAYIREKITQSVGSFPDRTPLNPRVTGVLERENYKIEKIVFESQPGFYVTANLYLPKNGRPPYPAILYPLGHERGGKSYPVWQQMLGALAQKGYVALTWDPLGQGERTQIYDRDWKRPKVGGSTTQHTVLGIQCLLVGDGIARYTIWDGIRALDYLLSRPEVDASRVGCTGNSGGGTHTAYLSALEDRIHVAAPSCYLTGWERLLLTIGPQDAEQNLPPYLADGLDHADFVHAFAPRPYLILSAVRDFFSIAGARGVYQEAQEVYALHGARGKIGMSEVDAGHGYHKPNRMAAYRWFGRWLQGTEDNESEPEIVMATARELWATDTGQVATSLGGETVFSLNQKRGARIRQKLSEISNRADLASYRKEIEQRVRKRIAYEPGNGAPPVTRYGEIEREGYRIEKLTYSSETGIFIPSLVFRPDGGPARKPAVLYIHGDGKSADAEAGGVIEKRVREGNVVLAVDLRGMGETSEIETRTGSTFERYFGQFDSAMTALLMDRTLVGMRALDIVRGLDLLAERSDVDSSKISAVGIQSAAVPLLHAAVLDSRIQAITLSEMLVSFESVIQHRIHQKIFENVIRGVLKSYDLADLVSALAPRRVTIEKAVDPLGMPVGANTTQQAYASPVAAYEAAGASGSLSLH